MKLFCIEASPVTAQKATYYSHRLGQFTDVYERDLFTAERLYAVDFAAITAPEGGAIRVRDMKPRPRNYYQIVVSKDGVDRRPGKPYAFLCYADDACPSYERHATLTSAQESFRGTAEELDRVGQKCEATIHFALLREEIAEYPDFTLAYGPRGVQRRTT